MQSQPAARPFDARDEIRKGALEAGGLHHPPSPKDILAGDFTDT